MSAVAQAVQSALWFDTETFSTFNLKKVGTYKYMETVELLLLSFALGDGVPRVVDVANGETLPWELVAALNDPSVLIYAHKADFDRNVAGRRISPTLFDPARWRCTMVQAYEHSLPGKLADLCRVLHVPAEDTKDTAGKELIKLFCSPNKDGSRNTRETHPEEWEAFKRYACKDIPALRQCAKRMPSWNYPDNPHELALWHLDQRINDRGVPIDVDFAKAGSEATKREKDRLAGRTAAATNGVVQAATQRDALLEFILEQHDIALPDMQASTLEKRLEDPALPEPVKELLRLRLASSLTSVSKFDRALEAVSSDGLIRGIIQFCGADRTGRDAGRILQPQNFPRPLKEFIALIDTAIRALKAGVGDLVFGDDTLHIMSSSLRGLIVALVGKKLVVVDLSNIEGRFVAWQSGELWKLQAFRDYDTYKLDDQGQRIADGKGDYKRVGYDLYVLAYARAFGISPEQVDKDMRQIGKVLELALGYQGGVGALVAMVATYGINLTKMAAAVLPMLPHDIHAKAVDQWYWAQEQRRTFDLPFDVYVACAALVKLWRRAHPNTVQHWYALEDGAKRAIRGFGPVIVGPAESHVVFDMQETWLRMRLPSGRYLSYPGAQIIEDKQGREKIRYLGLNRYTRQWSWLYTYGGKLSENQTQANAREKFVASWPHTESAGYEIALRSHDELITLAPDRSEFNAEHLSTILAAPVDWAPSLPLAAAGFEAYRYRKG